MNIRLLELQLNGLIIESGISSEETFIKTARFYDPDILPQNSAVYLGVISDFSEYKNGTGFRNIIVAADSKEFHDSFSDTSAFNYFIVAKETDLHLLQNKILDILDQEERIDTAAREVRKSNYSDENNSYYTSDKVYSILDNPFSICNPNGVILDFRFMDDEFRDSIDFSTSQNYVPVPEMFSRISKQVADSHFPVLFETLNDRPIRNIVGKITHENTLLGFLLVTERNRPFTDSDLLLVNTVCQLIALDMISHHSFNTPRDNMILHFISDLLKNFMPGEDAVNSVKKSLDYGKLEWNNLLVADIHSAPVTRLSVPIIRNAIESILPGSRSVMFDNYLVFHINTDVYDLFTKKVRNRLSMIAREHKIKLGLGYRYHNLADTRNAFEQGVAALQFGQHIYPDRNLYIYEDFLIFHILNQISVSDNLQRYCHPKVLDLIEYDRNYDTHYAISLYALILCGGRQTEAAGKLHIHRSTMLYRINKITEISGTLNFSDIRTISYLFITYSILIFTGQLEPDEYTMLLQNDDPDSNSTET